MKNKAGRQGGFLGLIVLIVIALVLAKYFYNLDVFQAADSEQGRATAGYMHQIFSTFWSYVGTPIVFMWQRILWPTLELIWQSFQQFLTWGQQTASTPIR